MSTARVLQPFIKHTGDVIDFPMAGRFLPRSLLLLSWSPRVSRAIHFPRRGTSEIINETTESRDLTFVRGIDRLERDGDGRFDARSFPLVSARENVDRTVRRLAESCIASKRLI